MCDSVAIVNAPFEQWNSLSWASLKEFLWGRKKFVKVFFFSFASLQTHFQLRRKFVIEYISCQHGATEGLCAIKKIVEREKKNFNFCFENCFCQVQNAIIYSRVWLLKTDFSLRQKKNLILAAVLPPPTFFIRGLEIDCLRNHFFLHISIRLLSFSYEAGFYCWPKTWGLG